MNQGHRMLQFILCVPLPQWQMFRSSAVTLKMSTYKSQRMASGPVSFYPTLERYTLLTHKLPPVFLFFIKCRCFLTWPWEEVSWTSVSKSVIVVECWLKRCINIRIFKRSYIPAPAHQGKPQHNFTEVPVIFIYKSLWSSNPGCQSTL